MWIANVILGSVWILLLSPTEVKGECTKPTTTENAVIHEDHIAIETFPNQATIKLKCHPGYEPSPSSSKSRLTCNVDQWSPEPGKFTCQKKFCSNPGDIINGNYEFLQGNEFGDIIKAQCKLGYYILGGEQRVCMANGEWDGQPPVCEAIKCGAPPEIPNGHPKLAPEDEYDYDHVVEYVCEKDYTLLGDATIRCLQDRSWSNAPRCKVVECKRLDIPNARRIEGNSGPYGHRDWLKYECEKGYRMANTTGTTGTVVCMEMGWTPTLVCEEIICPQVKSTNASITGGHVGPYRLGSFIRYRCQDGHTLVGSSALECQLDGQWSSDPPVCQEIKCPQVKSTNASITEGAVGPYRLGSFISYRCQDGHTLVGSATLECQSAGQWSADPPVCKEIICPQLKSTNASITGGHVGPYKPGSSIRYRCQDGQHKLDGSSTLNCQSDGQWSADPPVCKVMTCPVPKKTNATIIDGAGGPYTVDIVLKYECPSGTSLSWGSLLTCQSNRHWSSDPPFCKEDSGTPVGAIVGGVAACCGVAAAGGYGLYRHNSRKEEEEEDTQKRENIKLNTDPESV